MPSSALYFSRTREKSSIPLSLEGLRDNFEEITWCSTEYSRHSCCTPAAPQWISRTHPWHFVDAALQIL